MLRSFSRAVRPLFLRTYAQTSVPLKNGDIKLGEGVLATSSKNLDAESGASHKDKGPVSSSSEENAEKKKNVASGQDVNTSASS
jgi:hypothetical protein